MTDLIEVKTADLTGHALDWAVAQAEGLEVFLVGPQYHVPWRVFWKKRGQALQWDVLYNPHEDWALGGLLIEKNMVSL
ncbi:phage protein NinX family protein, partial [Pseudomonas guariconensis]